MSFSDFIVPKPGQVLGQQPKQQAAVTGGFAAFLAPSPGQGPTGPDPAVTPTHIDDPIFEMAFGFIPTLNMGTAMGIENSTMRLIANIVLDPFAWAPAFFSGGLTIAGRAATAANRLNATRSILAKTDAAAKGLGVSARIAEASNDIRKIAGVFDPKNKALLDAAIKAGEIKDTAGFIKNMRKVVKSKGLSEEAGEALKLTLDDLGRFKDLSIQEAKLVKQGLSPDKITEILGETWLKTDRVSQFQAGQRSLLRFKGNPFNRSADGKTIPLLGGENLYKLMDKLFKPKALLAGGTGLGIAKAFGTAGEVGDTRHAIKEGLSYINSNNIKYEAITKAAMDDVRAAVDLAAPGSNLDEVMPFLRESMGKVSDGLPVSVAEKAGWMDEMISMGFKPVKAVVRAPLDSEVITTFKAKASKDVVGIDIFKQTDVVKFLEHKGWLGAAVELNGHVGKAFDNFAELASIHKIDINEIANYITHTWENVGSKQATRLAKEMKKNGTMLNKRKFRSFVDGMNDGLKPTAKTATDLVEDYSKMIYSMIHNRNLIEILSSPKNRIVWDGVNIPMFASAKDMARLRANGVDTTEHFVNLAEEGLASAELLKRMNLSGRRVEKGGKTVKIADRAYVPKSLAHDLKVFTSKPFDNAAAEAMDKFNATSKVMSLALSLFHAGALTESAMATMGPVKGLTTAAKLGFGIPGLNRLMKKMGVKGISDDLIEDARRHNLATKAPSDVQRDKLVEIISDVSAKAGKFGAPVDLLGKGIKSLQTALWDNFHEPLKLIGYEMWVKKLKKLNPTADLSVLKRDAAARMNDTFGGQQWQQLLVNPRMKQMLHWALLAPDWTLSNARVAGLGTTGLKGLGRGIIGQGRNPSEQIIGAYWRTAIPVMYGTTALLNYSLSGKWPWENPPGHELDIALGTNDEKGRPEFMKLGKQMREPFRWLTDPMSILGGKMAPGAKEVIEQFSGRSPGGGYPTEFATKQGELPVGFVESIPKRLKNIGLKFVPFSLNGKSVLYTFPKSSFTETKALRGLIAAGRSGKLGEADAKEIRLILDMAGKAGFDIGRLKARARKEVGNPFGLLSRGQ